jgi:hypothetical protein
VKSCTGFELGLSWLREDGRLRLFLEQDAEGYTPTSERESKRNVEKIFRWEDNIKMDIRETVWENMAAIYLAQDIVLRTR